VFSRACAKRRSWRSIDFPRRPSAAIDLPFLNGEKSFSFTFTRAELEAPRAPIVERTRALPALARRCEALARDLDEVILVGGQTRMPLVRELVREIFSASRTFRKIPTKPSASARPFRRAS
jgi:molecular chaperone DnaK (HSP70)